MSVFCKRCLLYETEAGLAETVRAYIESMPAELRAAEGLYQRRLADCRACDNLVNGLCKLCGCFVEARAAKKNSVCPGSVW